MHFVEEAFNSSFQKELVVRPQHTNRASQAGIQCARRLQWHRTHWRDAKPIELGLAKRFKLGHVLEPVVLRALQDGGLIITQQNRDMEWVQFQLTGHIDCLVDDPSTGEEIVVDVKTCSEYVIDALVRSVKTAGDLVAMGGYKAGYIGQLAIYMLILSKKRGLLLFVGKESFCTFVLELSIDDPVVLNFAEAHIQRLEKVNAAIKEGVELDREEGDHCRQCPFVAACLPSMQFGAVALIDDNELEAALDQRDALRKAYWQYGDVDTRLKERFSEAGQFMVGDWIINVTKRAKGLWRTYERTPVADGGKTSDV